MYAQYDGTGVVALRTHGTIILAARSIEKRDDRGQSSWKNARVGVGFG